MGSDVEYTSVHRVEKAMATLHTGLLKMFNNDIVAKIKTRSKIGQRQDFFDAVVAVILISNLKDIGVLSTMSVVVGFVVMLVAAMMNGDFQS